MELCCESQPEKRGVFVRNPSQEPGTFEGESSTAAGHPAGPEKGNIVFVPSVGTGFIFFPRPVFGRGGS
jgi:hypothetical protein